MKAITSVHQHQTSVVRVCAVWDIQGGVFIVALD